MKYKSYFEGISKKVFMEAGHKNVLPEIGGIKTGTIRAEDLEKLDPPAGFCFGNTSEVEGKRLSTDIIGVRLIDDLHYMPEDQDRVLRLQEENRKNYSLMKYCNDIVFTVNKLSEFLGYGDHSERIISAGLHIINVILIKTECYAEAKLCGDNVKRVFVNGEFEIKRAKDELEKLSNALGYSFDMRAISEAFNEASEVFKRSSQAIDKTIIELSVPTSYNDSVFIIDDKEGRKPFYLDNKQYSKKKKNRYVNYPKGRHRGKFFR